VTAPKRLSHAISEGEGISLIVEVDGAEAAAAAEADGAEAVFVCDGASVELVRGATTLPVLWHGRGADPGVDASIVRPGDDAALADGVERVVVVHDDETLIEVLEELDPEIVLLAARDEDDPVQTVLSLLSDVPAGKLAIADVGAATREDVAQLERAGVDAVLLRGPLPAP
jgi:hypothetical protein